MRELIENTPIKKWAIVPALLTTAIGFYVLSYGFLGSGFFSPVALALGSGVGIYLLYGSDAVKAFGKPAKPISTFFLGLIAAQLVASISGIVVKFLLNVQVQPDEAVKHIDVLFLFKAIPMIFGEELLTFVILFIVTGLLAKSYSYKKALTIGVIVSTLVFSLLHLPSYDWNLIQVLLIIGAIRIPFTLASLRSNSLWEGFAVHYVYDTLIFVVILLFR